MIPLLSNILIKKILNLLILECDINFSSIKYLQKKFTLVSKVWKNTIVNNLKYPVIQYDSSKVNEFQEIQRLSVLNPSIPLYYCDIITPIPLINKKVILDHIFSINRIYFANQTKESELPTKKPIQFLNLKSLYLNHQSRVNYLITWLEKGIISLPTLDTIIFSTNAQSDLYNVGDLVLKFQSIFKEKINRYVFNTNPPPKPFWMSQVRFAKNIHTLEFINCHINLEMMNEFFQSLECNVSKFIYENNRDDGSNFLNGFLNTGLTQNISISNLILISKMQLNLSSILTFLEINQEVLNLVLKFGPINIDQKYYVQNNTIKSASINKSAIFLYWKSSCLETLSDIDFDTVFFEKEFLDSHNKLIHLNIKSTLSDLKYNWSGLKVLNTFKIQNHTNGEIEFPIMIRSLTLSLCLTKLSIMVPMPKNLLMDILSCRVFQLTHLSIGYTIEFYGRLQNEVINLLLTHPTISSLYINCNYHHLCHDMSRLIIEGNSKILKSFGFSVPGEHPLVGYSSPYTRWIKKSMKKNENIQNYYLPKYHGDDKVMNFINLKGKSWVLPNSFSKYFF